MKKKGKYLAVWDDSDWWTITYMENENSKPEVWLCIEGGQTDTKAKEIADAFNMMIAINYEPDFDVEAEEAAKMIKNFTNGYLQCIEDMVDLRELDIAVHNRLVTLENGIVKRAKNLLQ